MTVTNPQASPSPTIEDMVSSEAGIDALFDALDTDHDGHPADDPNGPDADRKPARSKPPKSEEPDPDESDDEDEGDETDEESEETTDSDETPDDDVPELELETTQVEQLFGLEEGAVSVDDDGKLTFKTNIDGELGTVHLQELVGNYQIKGHLTKQSQKFAEEKGEAQTYLQQQAQVLAQQLDSAEALTNAMRDQLVSQNNTTDWDDLRVKDPAEYAAKRQELGERYRQIDGYLQAIHQQREQQTQQASTDEQERMRAYVADQGQQLLANIPEWNDAAVRTSEMTEIKTYLASRGFTPEEMNNISDARHVMILRDAMRAGQTKKKVKAARKKVAAIPKVVKPGARQSQGQSKRGKRKAHLKKQKGTGSIDDTARVFFDMLDDV